MMWLHAAGFAPACSRSASHVRMAISSVCVTCYNFTSAASAASISARVPTALPRSTTSATPSD